MKRIVPAAVAVAAIVGCGGSPADLTIRGAVDVRGMVFVDDQAAGGPWLAAPSTDHCAASPPQQLTIEDGFTVKGVPAGKSEYGFSRPGAGTAWFTSAQVTKPVGLTLG